MSFNDLVKKQPLLGQIMDTLLDGVVTIEHSDTFTYANAGAAKIFGVSRKELENRRFCWKSPAWRPNRSKWIEVPYTWSGFFHPWFRIH